MSGLAESGTRRDGEQEAEEEDGAEKCMCVRECYMSKLALVKMP